MAYLGTKFGKDETFKGTEITLIEFQKALNRLYLSKNPGDSRISINNARELTLDIYLNSVVLQDYLSGYDGPGGPGEKYRGRINVKHIFDNAEKILQLLDEDDEEKLIALLKILPKVL